jgi:hypothetical protein
MKYSETPLGTAFKIAIEVGGGEEHEEDMDYTDNPHMKNNVKLAPAEQKYVESLYEIVDEYGKLSDNDGNGIWVGYVSAAENKDKAIGVKCSNCAFYCKEMKGCHIIKQEIEPEGYCRLAAIGEGLVKGRK